MAKIFLNEQVRGALEKLRALKTKAPAPTDHLLAEVLGELSYALEELQVSQEALKQQNEELISALGDLKTERQQLAKLASFPEMNPNPVLETGSDGNIHYQNPAVRHLFPDLQASGLNHPWFSGLKSIFLQFQNGKNNTQVRELKLGNLWYQQDLNYDSKTGRLRIYGLDITKRKKMEEDIRRFSEGLEIKIEERTAELKKANEEIAEQSKILESFYLHSLNPLVFLDRDFNFIRVNKAYAEAWQRRVADFSGQNLFKFYPHKDYEAKFRQVVETKSPYQVFAEPFSFPDHPERGVTYWDWSLTPLLDEAGEVELLIFSLNDVTEEQKIIESLRQNEALLQTVLKVLPIGVWIANRQGRIIQGNPAGQKIWGDAGKIGMALNGGCKGWWPETGNRVEPDQWAGARAFTKGEITIDEEVEIECSDGTRKIILNSAVPIYNDNQEITGAVVVNQDVTERMEIQKWTQATNALLDLFPRKTERKEYLEAVAELIQWWSGCQKAGILLMDEQGNISYESKLGFRDDFCKYDNWLSPDRDQCVCFRVVQGNPDPQDTPVMTQNGSFRCDNTAQFIAGLPEKERERFKGVCFRCGLLSVAVIPIRYQNRILGAIHLADEKEGRVPQKKVEFIEGMTPLIGEALQRFNLEAELKRNFDAQSRINTLLRLSLEEVSLDELLKRAIEEVVSFPWLGNGTKGCIFLVEENPDILVLKAQKGFPGSLVKQCAQVPFNRCLCGKAILKPHLDFIEWTEDSHDMGPEDNVCAHAHYFIPIHFAGKVLGLINIYLTGDQHIRNQEKEGFFKTIADALANIIIRKQGEGALRESENQLRLLSSKLLSSQEMERRKIALEVHDGIGSSLSAIKFMIEGAIQRLHNDPTMNITDSLEALVPIIQETIGEARRIQTDLSPPVLDELGISATFSWFCRRFQTIYKNIVIEQMITVPEEEVPDSLKMVLFRITQEAMNNIGKHSGADLIHLELRKVDGRIELVIRDNGKGFDLNERPSKDFLKRGVGLPSMKERAEYSGGLFTIESSKGEGTVIRASWPL